MNQFPLHARLLFFVIFFIPFQRFFVSILPSDLVAHAGCPYNWIKYSYFDTLLLLIFPFALHKISILIKERTSLLLLGFLALCLLSICTHSYGTYLFPLWFLVKLLGTSLLFFSLVIESTEREKEPLLKATQYTLLFSATLQGTIAILQFFKQASLGLKFLGEGRLDASRSLGAGFPVQGGSRWILDTLFHHTPETPMILRAQGTLDHPNHLGIFLVVGLTALISLFIKGTQKERRLLILPFIILFFALITTFSRASLFTWMISFLLITLLLKRGSLPLLKIALPLLLLCTALFYPQIQNRGGIISSTAVNRFADQERITYLTDALTMIKTHPVSGVGFHNYIARLNEFNSNPLSDRRPLIVHNIFLLISSELGLPALLLFLSLWALLLIRAWKQRHDPTTAIWGALLASLLFYANCDVFFLTDQQGQLTLFLSFGTLFLSQAVAAEKASVSYQNANSKMKCNK